MTTTEAIVGRRSIKRFTSRAVTRGEIETLLDLAVYAPNHKLTNPWRFYVLGPEARYAFGEALGARKAKKLDDPVKAAEVKVSVGNEHRALPAMIVVAVECTEDAERAEEDYASAMMAVQNIALAAVGMELGTHIKTGAIMGDPAARAAAAVKESERIVAIVHLGEPDEIPPPKPRVSAAALTTWTT